MFRSAVRLASLAPVTRPSALSIVWAIAAMRC
jgi:hypothetical protein